MSVADELGGIGVGNYEAPWAVGVRVNLARPGKTWRPHITGMHWTEGNGVYAGVDHDLGRPGGLVLTYGIGFGDVNLEARVGARSASVIDSEGLLSCRGHRYSTRGPARG